MSKDGVFISLWLLVQRRDVALEYALRQLSHIGLPGFRAACARM